MTDIAQDAIAASKVTFASGGLKATTVAIELLSRTISVLEKIKTNLDAIPKQGGPRQVIRKLIPRQYTDKDIKRVGAGCLLPDD